MDVDRVLPRLGESHAAEDVRLAAEGLAVEEVAPAADALADEQTVDREIAERAEGDRPLAAPQDHEREPREDAAVDGETALPDLEDIEQVAGILVPAEDHVIQPRADDDRRDQPEDEVIEIVRRDADEFFAAVGAVEDAEQKAQRDHRAVKIERPPEEHEGARRVDREVSEHGEADERRAQNRLHMGFPPRLL